MAKKPEDAAVPQAFYTVTAEIALARHQPRLAALQYAAAAARETDIELLARATQVATESLQPTLAEKVAARWISIDPKSVEAQRAAARAALALHKIDQAAAHYGFVLAQLADRHGGGIRGARDLPRRAMTTSSARASSRIDWPRRFRPPRRLCGCRGSRRCVRTIRPPRYAVLPRRWRSLPSSGDQTMRTARRELRATLARARDHGGRCRRAVGAGTGESRARRYARQSPRLRFVADDGAARFGGDAAIGDAGAQRRIHARWRCACWGSSNFRRGISMPPR